MTDETEAKSSGSGRPPASDVGVHLSLAAVGVGLLKRVSGRARQVAEQATSDGPGRSDFRAAHVAFFSVMALASANIAFGFTPLAGHSADRESGFDAVGMDRSIPPGDDFYAFANGNWLRSNHIPEDRSTFGVMSIMADTAQARTRSLLASAASDPGSAVGAFYASFLDEGAVERAGLKPLAPWIAELKAVPDREALIAEMGKLQRIGVTGLFDVYVDLDAKDPNAAVPTIEQAGLGLPDRDDYLGSEAQYGTLRSAYRTYLERLLTLEGETDVAPRVNAIISFETQLAKGQWDAVARRDTIRIYNPVSPADLRSRAPALDWNAYLRALDVGLQPRLIVREPDALAAEAAAWRSAPLPVLKDWLLVRMLDDFAPYLVSGFVDANFAFRGKALSGANQQTARWKRGVDLLTTEMGDAVGREYTARYFPPESKAAAQAMARNILAAYRVRLSKTDWLAPATRRAAIAKLTDFDVLVGYPDKWIDYRGLRIRRGDLLGNVARAEEFRYNLEIAKLGKPVDRHEFYFSPATLMAWASPQKRMIAFTAAFLQPPFFNPKADPAVNYGAIGVVIGHEISHSFDDQGRKFDATGRLADWWTQTDVKRFSARAASLAAQYDSYQPLPGTRVNGDLTLGENLADLAGITASYDAYQAAYPTQRAFSRSGFTGSQLFFLSFAQSWRKLQRETALRKSLLSDPHAPPSARVDEVRNLDSWYSAFKVPASARLYLPPGERVRIW